MGFTKELVQFGKTLTITQMRYSVAKPVLRILKKILDKDLCLTYGICAKIILKQDIYI